MRAVVFDRYGPPEVLRVGELPDPEPGPGQVRVQVRPAGVQPFDVGVRRGEMTWLPVTFPQTIGQEYSGVIDRLGAGAAEAGLEVGAAVLGSTMMNGAIPVAYGDGLLEAVRATGQTPTVALDAAGGEAIGQSVRLGIELNRIGTIVDDKAAAEHGTRVVRAGRSPQRLAEVIALNARAMVTMPIRAYPLSAVAEAHAAVESRHGRGKVVLILEQ